jgi:hypothetical protein
MTINETYQEIALITQKVIENGLSIQEKWPKRQGNKIAWQDQTDISIALKNIPYVDKYQALNIDRNYNFKMVDGALIQFMYEFDHSEKNLVSHRLAFFPSPHLERYDSIPEEYENVIFADSEFHDMFEKNIIAFPIRFDYNVNPKFFKEIEHPYSHVSFGEYEFCRIPVNAPLSPSIFINFILRNFYNYAIRMKGEIIPQSDIRFKNCITGNEKKIIHFNIYK